MPGTALSLDRPAIHVDVDPGGEIVLRGVFTSTHDGSVVDAATTTWPDGAPGGGSVDAGGLVDFEAGGFHLTSRDTAKHEVHAVATGEANTACAALGVAAPCLPLRTLPAARSRLLTVDAWSRSLKGGMTLEVVGAPAYAPATAAVSRNAEVFGIAAALAVAALGTVFFLRRRKRIALSPRGRLVALAKRVQAKLGGADPVVAAPLAPAIAAVLATLGRRSVDPTTGEGKRIADVLERVESRLDEKARRAKEDEEKLVADELVREMEAAIEAADESDLDVSPKRRAG